MPTTNNATVSDKSSSLKSLANKVLERLERNTVSGPVHERQPERELPKSIVTQLSSLAEAFEERLGIAEVDGCQNPMQAHRISYLDAFITLLSALAEDDSHQDWLDQKIQMALATLEAQNFPTLN